MEEQDDYLTIKQAAAITGLSPTTVRRAIADGRIDGWRHKRALRVKRADLAGLFHRVPNAKG